jgi:hypothetical protein
MADGLVAPGKESVDGLKDQGQPSFVGRLGIQFEPLINT